MEFVLHRLLFYSKEPLLGTAMRQDYVTAAFS